MVELVIKTRLPSKRMLERIPTDVWTAAKPWLEKTGVELAREIRYRIAVQHKGANPSGQETFLPRLSVRYAKAVGAESGAPDYHRTGQMIASIQPRVMVTKKGQAKLLVKPYGRRQQGEEQKLSKRQGRALPVFQAKWEGGYESFVAEMEDYGFLHGDMQENRIGPRALPELRYWVDPHMRGGSTITPGGSTEDDMGRLVYSKSSWAFKAKKTGRTQSGHNRESHVVAGHWRTLPSQLTPGQRKSYWGAAIEAWVTGENRRRGAKSPKAAQNATVADALSRRLGGGKWAPVGRRVSPFIAFSQKQIQETMYRWHSGMGGKVQMILQRAIKPGA